jgi:hypothetical protein
MAPPKQPSYGASAGRSGIFASYRLRVTSVLRDYTMTDRAEAPADSREVHTGWAPA